MEALDQAWAQKAGASSTVLKEVISFATDSYS